MKFQCPSCKQQIPADQVLAHEAFHKNDRTNRVRTMMGQLSAEERLYILHLYCDLCGWTVNPVGDCSNPDCDDDPIDGSSERPQGGGGPDQSPLETAPTPVGVRPMPPTDYELAEQETRRKP